MKDLVSPIALLGTSADPPTFGHKSLLEELSKLFPKVVTWASDNPMKVHGASLKNRQELLQALVKDIAIPHIEVKQDISSPWTIKTLKEAKKYWPESSLVFVIGSDLIEQIPQWLQVKDILAEAQIAIAPRKNWPLNHKKLQSLKQIGARIDILPVTIPASASSDIRNKTERNQVPSVVMSILTKNKLYGF